MTTNLNWKQRLVYHPLSNKWGILDVSGFTQICEAYNEETAKTIIKHLINGGY